ncbi:MAG TPA: hypothetical protein VN089_08555 [Duganella sp.]|nr:hypothetical protein [Duganella sp.]
MLKIIHREADYATSNFSWEMFSIVRDEKKHPAAGADGVFFECETSSSA